MMNENNQINKEAKDYIEQFTPMIKKLASKWTRNPRVPFDDLVSVGMMTLWEATLTWDQTRGYKESTYFWTCINHAMAKYCLKNRYQLKYSIGKKISVEEINERESRMVKVNDYSDIFFIERHDNKRTK